jgi:transposase
MIKKRNLMVVMEATGGYEKLLVNQLAHHGIAVSVVNPRQVRDFAKGIGMDAKTDPIDDLHADYRAARLSPQSFAPLH